jgi:hypothetical protein
MRNEGDVKKAVKEILNKVGAWWYMPPASPYGRIGVPDFICCLRGKFFSVETKFGYNKPTARQEIEMQGIRKAEGTTLVINENNIRELQDYVDNV